MAPPLRIIERHEWGARYRDGFGNRPVSGIRWQFLHHSVTGSAGPDATFEQDAANVRELERIGQSRFGGGISYGFAVSQAGRIFRGHSRGRVGAHTRGYNTTGDAVVLIGNYDGPHRITKAQFEALVWLQQNEIGQIDRGHRDVAATACPGRYAYGQLPALRAAAAGQPIEVTRPVPPPPAPDRSGWLGIGSTGAAVLGLQKHLNRRFPSYSRLDEDGIFGPATAGVVKEFQRRVFITVDGIVGPATLGKLDTTLAELAADAAKASPAPAPIAPAPPAAKNYYQRGDSGSGVRELQQVLNRWYPRLQALKVDGIFGPATEARVRYFQSRARLAVDGVAGTHTLRRLGLTYRG